MWYKRSLDLSFLKSVPGPEGSYGKYTTNYSPDIKNKIKEELGLEDDNLGIKVFHSSATPIDFFSENLALNVFGPEINNKTDLIAPTPPSAITLANLMNQKYLITEHLGGMDWGMFLELLQSIKTSSSYDRNTIKTLVIQNTRNSTLNKLGMIGIKWGDFGSNNIKLDEKVCERFIEQYNQSENKRKVSTDLSHNLRILDFGWMYSLPQSESFSKLIELKRKMQQLPQETYVVKIINTIDYIIDYNDTE